MNLWDATALAVTFGLFAGIFALARKRVNFSVLTFIGLFLGTAVGVVFRNHVEYVQPIGRIYVNLLLTIVAPLVIVSILSSITSLGSTAQLKTIGGRSVYWLLSLNLVAIFLALGTALLVGLGKGANLATDVDTRSLDSIQKPFTDVLIGFFPTNIVKDISENNIIPIILVSILVAVSCSVIADKAPQKVAPFKALVEAVREIIYRAVGFVISLTPYAVLALTAAFTSTVSADTSQLWPLFTLLVVAFVVCFAHTYLVNGVFLRTSANVSPVAFFRKILPAQVTAFSTQSSAGTLPLTTSLLRSRVGVPSEIAGFTAPLGTTIGMPGCAGIWPILLAVYAVNALGIPYGLSDYAVLVILGLLVSIGTAGVPGTATVTATTVLAAAGLPLEVVILTLPISALADMARTTNNVTSAAVAATIVARKEGRLDDAIFDAPDADVTTLALTAPDDEPTPADAAQPDDDALWGSLPVGACAIEPSPRERVGAR
ncbi:dicarboxylate/amino acid:cation symporter [Cellulomonas rhizosphaerae]|uniref:L-cystine uptake protein TcyP n=1 Tax=Cellulomonas rhizosphaerae TaxID=2293719 RepID=A0A413RLN2_9CELL|nr:dicarboxylate/amino acid:cation symporter [Cellulomonas rhizosphaerae]RHA40978.1 dicarboxylate/amino acid:cation symporter [Cellulomonas rhizosphaerae]